MEIKAGDKVRFLDATGGGLVTRTEGKMAFVEDEDGFEIPVLISELVLVERDSEKEGGKSITESSVPGPGDVNREEPEEDYEYEEDDSEDEDPKFYLAFLQGDKPGVQSGSVRISIINDSNYFCYYAVNETGNNGQAINLFSGKIEPATKFYLGRMLITELDGSRWDVHVVFYKKSKRFVPVDPANVHFVLKGSKLVNDNNYKENDYFAERAFLLPVLKGKLERSIEELTSEDIDKIKKEKTPKKIVKKVKRRDEPDILEVDLHIEELLDDTRGLSNSEILKIQMDKFHQVMKENLKRKKRKIVFIHGVGNGILKTEIRKALDRKYKEHYYQDASFREYGFGATMVIIR